MVLRSAYGASIRFGMVDVHTYVDTATETLMVPVMFMRVDAPRANARELHRLLAQRGARLQEIDLQDERVVLRAELHLAHSLGLELEVDALTNGQAHVLAALVRYERAPGDGRYFASFGAGAFTSSSFSCAERTASASESRACGASLSLQ